ncbi:MAG: hypothetical protein N2508_05760 [Anaerolineae bacterium]|nr:hypothetical protein [Anaerolineae bacterium]
MRAIVVLGRVLDPAGIVVNRRAGRIFVNREEYILPPADRCALEAAMRIKDATGCEVIALPRALFPDDDVLRQALAIGADRAIYLSGRGPDCADDAFMASVLAAAIRQLGGADLVLTGATTLDTGWTQLGPRLAEILDWPQILDAWQVEVQDSMTVVQAVVPADGGYALAEADLPALVTIAAGALKLRYPNGVRLINVYRGIGAVAEALERWEWQTLLEERPTPVLERRGQEFPPERERGVRVSGSAAEMARAVAGALRQRLGR